MAGEDVVRKMADRARVEVAQRAKLKPALLLRTLARSAPKAVTLEAALRRAGAPVVIAGLWRRNPGRILDRDLPMVEAVAACEEGGAVAVAVATETAYFGAVVDDFPRVRAATRLPLVRRECVVDPYQLAEARIAGASAGWLVEAVLPGKELPAMLAAARDVGLETLVEVVTDDGLVRALDAGAAMVVVSASPAMKESPDEARARALHQVALALRSGALAVVAGVDSPAERAAFESAGATVFLVDAPLVLADDKREALRAWRSAGSHG
jgi:indole-3-glycerol phosphate synthase